MSRFIKKLIALIGVVIIITGLAMPASAHPGRTDGSGGHRDNKNASGLGSYHYHCGGYPAHLHISGYCPYRDVFPKGVTLNADKTSLAIGEQGSITAKVSPSNACNTSVSWTSSDPAIVRVSGGTITAVGFGTATISASTFNDKVGSIKVSVREVVADSITITGYDTAPDDESNTIYIGDELTLNATILPENVDNTSVAWSSSSPEILNVEDGKVTALQAGSATITAASSNGKTDAITFSVEEVVAERIEIVSPETVTIGDKIALNVKFYPDNTSYKDIEWKSSNPNVLTVDNDGILKAVSVGTANVTAIQKDVQAKLTLEVQPIAAKSIGILAPNDFEGRLSSGNTAQLEATIFPEDATYKDITWTSDNPNVITVDENGLVTAVSAGTALITACSVDGVETTVQLRVPSILIPVILAAVALLIISAATLIVVKSFKSQSATEDADTKKDQKKKTVLIIGISILLLAIDAVAGHFFTLSGKYERAAFLANCNRPFEAMTLFDELGSYKAANEQFAQLLEANPELSIQFASPGEIVAFGHYEQDGDTKNGKEPIEWILLGKDEENAMLVSKCIIDAKPLVEIENEDGKSTVSYLLYFWDDILKETDTCPLKIYDSYEGIQTIYDWLSADFAQEAFEEFDNLPVTELRLLTRDEVSNYITHLEDPEWTQHALNQKPKRGLAAGIMWWLDDAGPFNSELTGAVVWEDNSYGIERLEAGEVAGVRPLILIALK